MRGTTRGHSIGALSGAVAALLSAAAQGSHVSFTLEPEQAASKAVQPDARLSTFLTWLWSGSGVASLDRSAANMVPDVSGCATHAAGGGPRDIQIASLGRTANIFGIERPDLPQDDRNKALPANLSLAQGRFGISDTGSSRRPGTPGTPGGSGDPDAGPSRRPGANPGSDDTNPDGEGNDNSHLPQNSAASLQTFLHPFQPLHNSLVAAESERRPLKKTEAVPIPLPAPVWMGLAGLGLVGLLCRRRA